MEIVWALLLAAIILFGWTLNLFGIPGNWINVCATLLYLLLTPADLRVSIGWPVFGMVFALAVVGEVVEFAAGAAGAKKAGGSRRAAVLALMGGLAGGIVGMFAGSLIPIPGVGSIIGALLFAGLGAMGGAIVGETWAGGDAQQSWQVGKAAFWGRLFGTLGKILVGSIIVAVVWVALVVK